MNKINSKVVKRILQVFIIMLIVLGGIIGIQYFKYKEITDETLLPPYPYDEKMITFIPYDEDVDDISLEEQIEIVAKSSGAGIIVIVTYEQKEKNLIENFQEEIYELIKREDVIKVEIEGKNRYILRGEIIEYLFK